MSNFFKSYPTLALIGGLLSITTTVSASCGAAACPIHPTIASVPQKWTFSLDYTYIGQPTLMSGTNTKDPNSSTKHHTELETYTRTLSAQIGYQFDTNWGISATIPYIWRKHAHTHHHHGDSLHDEWDINGLGDTWIDGSYTTKNSFLFGNPLITEIGIKLATGAPRKTNDSGTEAEIPIQPGSGSTDYRVGLRTQFPIAVFKNLDSQHSELSGQFLTRYTLTGMGSDGWRAGDELLISARATWSLTRSAHVLGGLNSIYRMKAEAGTTKEDIESTGGHAVLAEVGLLLTIAPHIQWSISGWVPIYQTVNGENLGIQSIAQTGFSVQI